jgi:hypothetical protein
MSDHTRIYRLLEEGLNLSDTEKPAFFYGNGTFKLSDTEEPGWFLGMRRFKLSDTEELKFFYRKRLDSISKEVLDKITFCWCQRLAMRLSKQQMEAVWHIDFSKRKKCGSYHDLIICTSHS